MPGLRRGDRGGARRARPGRGAAPPTSTSVLARTARPAAAAAAGRRAGAGPAPRRGRGWPTTPTPRVAGVAVGPQRPRGRAGAAPGRRPARSRPGDTDAARRLAGHALARHPDDRYARRPGRTPTTSSPSSRDGWPDADPGRPAALRAPARRRCCRCWPSRCRTCPAATRPARTASSPACAGLGWDVEAVTRLGFPYDRWSKERPAPVSRTTTTSTASATTGCSTRPSPGRTRSTRSRRTSTLRPALVEHARARTGRAAARVELLRQRAGRPARPRPGSASRTSTRCAASRTLMKVSRDPAFDGSDRGPLPRHGRAGAVRRSRRRSS